VAKVVEHCEEGAGATVAKPENEALKALVERGQVLLAVDASPAAMKLIDGKLQTLSATLFLEWLVADRRFETQSQQTEYWLSRFYEEVFVDEQPDATRIYNRFRLNLPRAGYLARLLRARRAAHWRQAARLELKTQLGRHEAGAREARKEGQAHVTEFDVSLSPGAADELRVLYDKRAAFVPERERPKPPKAKPSFGNYRWLGVPAETLLLILDDLKTGGGK
jgi:hypothetical protein